MRWLALIFACSLVIPLIAEPEPKKYKPDPKEKRVKDVKAVDETSITEEERTFLREIEAKFGIKDEKFDDVLDEEEQVSSTKAPEESNNKGKEKNNEENKNEENLKPFPAVIAIEIVNDTNAESKGKRTIDANLGYGYRTNTGYSYTYFGKPKHEQGKFMIYPYSQEDIPPARTYNSFHHNSHQPPPKLEPITKPYYQPQYSHKSQNVEIQPSQAYELVEVTEQPGNSYSSHGALSEISSGYERVKSHEQPPPPPPQKYAHPDVHPVNPATLFTTYNGGQISDLSGNFPSVMPNYFIDSSQLLRNPLFKSVGLTSDHIRQHGPNLEQPVVPVLILRIPSTHLNNPEADLYPNLPANYPLSNYLNRLNLQNLVAQYFKKVGYPHVPEIMTHYDAPAPTQPTHYSTPTQTQYLVPHPTQVYHQVANVPYSPVPTAEATYPVLMNIQPGQHYSVQQPTAEPQYHYEQPAVQTYQYVSSEQAQPQISYQPQYQVQPQYVVPTHYQSQPQYQTQYQTQPQYQYVVSSAEQQQSAHNEYQQTGVNTEQEADHNKESHQQAPHDSYEIQSTLAPEQHEDAPNNAENVPTEQPHISSTETSNLKESMEIPSHTQAIYDHAHHTHPNTEELQITENYPSKDHTQVKILPADYNKHVASHAQSISYVTPPPHKYHQYRIMAPQMPMNYAYKPAAYRRPLPSPSYVLSGHESSTQDSPTEYKLNTSFLPQVGVQRPPQYPRYYHAHPKRVARPEHKRVITVSLQQRKRENSEKKTASPPK